MTQGSLAERSNLTTNYIGKIERGESQPTIGAILSIADALKVNPSRLFSKLDRSETKEDLKKRIRELLDRL
jgi:transcriptional regulator with XRE-family HTH domain